MELAEYNVFADKCFRDTPPPCAAVCPLAYDVREFIRLMRKGSLRSAYKVIQRDLIFPSVITRVCPQTCRRACVRGRLGEESIDLRSLETICVEKMAGKKPERFNIPQKKETIAVIGAGLSGLACAYRLASFGYQVKVYEKTGLIGGSLPAEIDRQWAHDELTRDFYAVKCDFIMETEVQSVHEIQADALYIATGRGGNAFRDDRCQQDCGSASQEGQSQGFPGMVVRGGGLTGADLMEAVRMGLTAAEDINNELLTDRSSDHIDRDLSVPERPVDERYYALHYDTSMPEVIPDKGEAEAFRCMRCNCSECYDVCPLMEKHKQFPKKICTEVIVTLKPNKSRRTAVRLIMGCTQCNACREACPEHIDMGRCLQEAKTDFYESGVMSPAFHDYWLQDMEFCQSDQARLLAMGGRPCGEEQHEGQPSHGKNPGEQPAKADVLYFPGCQLSASMPELTIRSYEALAKVCRNPAILLGCCGVPAKWAGHTGEYAAMRSRIAEDWEKAGRPLVVTACPSCLESLKDLHPDMKIVSWYRFAADHPEMLEDIPKDYPDLGAPGDCRKDHPDLGAPADCPKDHPDLGAPADCPKDDQDMTAAGQSRRQVKIIDPCSSISEPGMGQAVRSLLEGTGYDIINQDPDPACCGFGGHIYNAVPALHDTFARRRIEDIKDTDAIAASYCANCRDILAYQGTDARHVLGMLLGIQEEKRMPPELGDRRENRRRVKRYFTCQADAPGKDTERGTDLMEIMISEELIRKMDRDLILREQVAEIICMAEETSNKLYDEEDNIFIAHQKMGAVTIWVTYSYAEDKKIMVENVYCHRMEIREDQ